VRAHPYAHAPRLPEGDALDPASLLGRSVSRLELEIGTGRGGFLLERLESDALLAMIGLEIRYKWAAIVDARLKTLGLGERGRVFAEDARSALPRLRGSTLHAVFVHFPDPWWKRRHKKRLLVTAELVAEVGRLLVPGGELFLQTDVEERAEQYQDAVESSRLFVPWGDSARVAGNPYGARSPRERRVEADGLPVVRLRYRRPAA
jgi:tRNA (guanine-N7-)-methyltransferase